MPQKNEPTSKEITPKKRLKIVKKELWKIFTSYLNEDKTVDALRLKEKYPGLGQPPFQQQTLVNYILDKHPELKSDRSALTAQVQRVANDIRKRNDETTRKIIHFKTHRNSSLGSPDPSRLSEKKILDKLKDLEEFKRKFENLLTSGRPEPETFSNDKEE